MFVVGTVQRVARPDNTSEFDLRWPVVFEDEAQGFVGGQIATRNDRETAQKVADALNAVLEANP